MVIVGLVVDFVDKWINQLLFVVVDLTIIVFVNLAVVIQ